MGLDMYLYRMGKDKHKAICDHNVKESEFNKKWNFLNEYPKKDNGWEIDDEKCTDEQKSVLKEFDKECKELNKLYHEVWDGINEYAYWRKFNALHGYIVRKFANGVDECQEIMLTADNINTLVEDLEKTLKTINEVGIDNVDVTTLEIRPTGGFFFGSTEIDNWFCQDIAGAIDTFKELRESFDEENEILYYQASW